MVNQTTTYLLVAIKRKTAMTLLLDPSLKGFVLSFIFPIFTPMNVRFRTSQKQNHESASSDRSGTDDEKDADRSERMRCDEESGEDLSMPVDVRVDFDDVDNTYQSEDGMNDDEVSEVSTKVIS